jgi:hypothetical protein
MIEIITNSISIINEVINGFINIFFNTIEFGIHFIDNLFIEQTGMSNIFLTTNIAIITVLIPVAIAIFFNEDGGEFKALDKNLIIDYIVSAKALPFYLILLFLPFIFFHTNYFYLKLIVLIVWFYAILFFFGILKRSYSWIKMNRYKFRFDFLNKQMTLEDIEQSWNSVWASEKIDAKNERKFFDIFSKKIESLFSDQNNIDSSWKLLSDFNDFTQLRKITTLALENGVLSKVLDWHNKIYHEEETLRNDSKKWIIYSSINTHLDSIFLKICERALTENHEYSFFSIFAQHINRIISKMAQSREILQKESGYINEIFQRYYIKFFDVIEKSGKSNNGLWKRFPVNWKVTMSNLKENAIIANITLRSYLEWAQNRIWKLNESFDKALDEISWNLFPETEPGTWAKIMFFIFTPYGGNRIKTVIERPWNFGFISRPFVGDADDKDFKANFAKKMEEQEKRTYELALFVFKNELKIDNLNNSIEELRKLEYPKESDWEIKRKKLLRIFEGMFSIAKEAL